MKRFVSVDPGKQGYIVLWTKKDTHIGEDVDDYSFKDFKLPLLKNREIDHNGIYQFLKDNTPEVLVMEQVGIAYKAGSKALTSMGIQQGVLIGFCVALNIPYIIIHPRTWQSKMFHGIQPDLKSKEKSILAINRILPQSSISNDNLADALLLGMYYLRYVRQ